MCHLDVIVLRGQTVECATCGARGELATAPELTWTDLRTSVLSMDEKRAHAAEIQQTAAEHHALQSRIDDAAAVWSDYTPFARPTN
jgi:hypothetical protein